MSHQAVVKTQIRDLQILSQALQTFGQGLLFGAADERAKCVTSMDNQSAPCEAVILPLKDGTPAWRTPMYKYQGNGLGPVNYREIGLQRQEDGTYQFVGDLSCPRPQDADGPCLPRSWGWPNYAAEQQYPLLLREYAVQCGLTLAQSQGMSSLRFPAATAKSYAPMQRPSLGMLMESAPEGSEILLLTGGYLPAGMTLVFTANPDGTTSIAVDGGVDHSCYTYTRPFEEALGTVLGDFSTLETAHVLAGPELVHIARP